MTKFGVKLQLNFIIKMILYKTNLVKGGKEDQIEQVTGQLSQTLPTKVFKKTIKQFFFFKF